MLRSLRVWFLVLSGCLPSTSQDSIAAVRDWLPMTVGDRWIYQTEILDGTRQRPEVAERFERQEETVALENIPEGILIRRKVTLRNYTARPIRGRVIMPNGQIMNAPPLRQRRVPDQSNILVRGNCVYYLGERDRWRWDASNDGLSSGFRQELMNEIALPDVCFPLHINQTWGHPDAGQGRGRDLWTVAGFGAKNSGDPDSVTSASWRLEASLGSGDDDYVWFQPGVGITGARTYHNGTFADFRVRLESFTLGR